MFFLILGKRKIKYQKKHLPSSTNYIRKEILFMLKKIPRNLFIALAIFIFMSILTNASIAQYAGECWAADYYNVFKIASNGKASQFSGFSQPLSLSVNPTDGSCWVADTDAIVVKKLSAAGKVLFSIDMNVLTNKPISVVVDPRDGSCWVGNIDTVFKFSSDGKQLAKVGGFNEPILEINPKNGNVWVADSSNARIIRLSESGAKLGTIQIADITQPKSISVNPLDGSCWVLDSFTHKLVKLSADGKTLVETVSTPPNSAIMSTAVAASTDGGCWVAVMIDMSNDQVIKFTADGKKALSAGGFSMPYGLAVDPKDGGCWVADSNGGKFVKLSSGGQAIINISGFTQPKIVKVGYTGK